MAAGSTYTPIATQTLASNTASVTFSSISASYSDLILVANIAINTLNPSVCLQFNSDTGTNYSMTNLRGNGTSALSARESSATLMNQNYFALPSSGSYASFIINLMNYSNSTTYKTVLTRSNNADTGTQATVGLWRSTAAINSIKVLLDSGTPLLLSGSTFTLYGIAAA